MMDTFEQINESKLRGGIDRLVVTSHGASKAAGWWTDARTNEDQTNPAYLKRYNIIPTKLALVHSEVSEALEGARKNRQDEHLPHRSSVEVELADAVIRIADLAGAMGLDLSGAIVEKLAYNAQRADHKPENRAKDDGKKF